MAAKTAKTIGFGRGAWEIKQPTVTNLKNELLV
jgi:hypothetical protein